MDLRVKPGKSSHCFAAAIFRGPLQLYVLECSGCLEQDRPAGSGLSRHQIEVLQVT